MVICQACGRKIEETMEGIYPGKTCANCFSDSSGKKGLRVGIKVSDSPLPINMG